MFQRKSILIKECSIIALTGDRAIPLNRVTCTGILLMNTGYSTVTSCTSVTNGRPNGPGKHMDRLRLA